MEKSWLELLIHRLWYLRNDEDFGWEVDVD